MADGLLADLGAGLQGAGAVLSPQVYQTQAQERADILPNIARRIQISKAVKELQADEDFSKAVSGLQPSAMNNSAALMDAVKGVPLDVLAASPKAHQFMGLVSQIQSREAAAQARTDALNARYEQIDMMRQHYEEVAANTALSLQQRADAQKANEELRQQMLNIQAQAHRDNIELRRDALAAAGAAKADATAAKTKAAEEKVTLPVQDIISDIDQAIKMIQQNPGITGARGMFSRVGELVKSELSGDTNTPANDFQSTILQIQSKYRKLPTIAANRFKADASKIDQMIKGLGIGTNDTIAINNLTKLKESLTRGLEARGGQAPTDDSAPKDKPMTQGIIAKNPKTGERVISTDGGKTWEPLYDK